MLDNLARQEQEFAVSHHIGFVEQSDDNSFLVCVDSVNYKTKRAVSCLQLPEAGDKVLMIMDREECFILAVLEKKEKHNKLVFDGDTEFVAKNGKISMVSQGGLDCMTSGSITFVSSELEITAEKGNVHIADLTVMGSHLLAKLAKIKILGGTLDSLFDRFRQKTKHSYREVAETDYLKSGQLDYSAENLMALHGKYSFISAEEDVKINGERIHMG